MPDWSDEVRARLTSLHLSPTREAEIVEELSQHLDDRYHELTAAGVPPVEATRQTLAAFRSGDVLAKSMSPLRQSRIAPAIVPGVPAGRLSAELAGDLRRAARGLWKHPGVVFAAVLTLSLGIGASVAIFSVLNALLLRPLPYPRPEQLMFLQNVTPALRASGRVSPPEYFEFAELNQTFAAVGAYQLLEMNLGARDRPRRVITAAVTAEGFAVLGVQPLQGRVFTPDEMRIPVPAIVVLSHQMWQSAFAGREDLVGDTIEVNGTRREVVGIMPPGFDIMDNHVELMIPAALNRANRQNRGNHVLSLVGRLKDGVTRIEADRELTGLLASWGPRTGASGHVFDPAGHFLQMTPMHDAIIGSAARAVGVLQAAVVFLLLIACANFASLLLARSEARRREFAVRMALGAGRFRLLRQFVAEGILLSALSTIIGIGLAWAGVRSIVQLFPDGLPRAGEIAIDQATLGFAAVLAIGTGIGVGLTPLLHVSRVNLETALREGGARGTTQARHRLRRGLVAAEVALAVMLVAGASLMLRTVANLTSVDAGFDRSRLVTFTTAFPGASYPSYARRYDTYNRIVSSLRANPGIEAVSGMSGLPPLRQLDVNDTTFSNFTESPSGPPAQVDFYQRVEPDYFETMRIPIVAGRAFQLTDLNGPFVTVVNENLARTYWPGASPIGQTITPCCGNPTYTVVGVAGDVRQGGVDQEAGTEAYFFDTQRMQVPDASGGGVLHLVIRTALPVAALRSPIERAVREADPALPVTRLRQMDDVFTETLERPRLITYLLTAFAGLALLLTAIGTYGVLSYTVAERRREIGIRMALGARRRRVIEEVMRPRLALTLAGIAVGVAGGLTLTQLMEALLFGIQPNDPLTFVAVVMVILTVGFIACFLPAHRASRLDPLIVLHDE